MPIAASESLIHVSIQAETLFTIGPLRVTNSMVGAVLASVILLVAFWIYLRRPAIVPGRFQLALELPIEWLAGRSEERRVGKECGAGGTESHERETDELR